jgi:hypothetical protein
MLFNKDIPTSCNGFVFNKAVEDIQNTSNSEDQAEISQQKIEDNHATYGYKNTRNRKEESTGTG